MLYRCGAGQSNADPASISAGSTPVAETSVVSLNTVNEPILAISPGGRLAWALMNDDGSTNINLLERGSTVQIPGGDNFLNGLQVNDSGQVTWAGSDGNDTEIYLYSNGATKALTNNVTDDSIPQINSHAQVVWVGYDDNSMAQIFIYDNGLVSQASNGLNCSTPMINSEGDVAWIGYRGGESQVYLRQNGVVTKVSNSAIDYIDDESPLEEVRLNDGGMLAWTGPVDGNLQIFLYGNGQAAQLTSGYTDHRECQLDNEGQVVWQSYDGEHYQIFLYDKGKTFKISQNEYDNIYPRITDDGSIFWVTREWKDGWYYRDICMISAQSAANGLYEQAQKGDDNLKAGSQSSVNAGYDPPRTASSFSFAVLGDSRSNSSGSKMNEDFLKFFVKKMTEEIKPQFVIFNGDQVMDCEEWQNGQWQYQERPWTNLMAKISDAGIGLYLVKGNHELYAWKDGDRDGKGHKSPHIRMFAQDAFQNDPEIQKHTLGGYPDSTYKWMAYTFDYGNSFFIIFDAFHVYKAYNDAEIKKHPLRYYNDEAHYGTVGDTHLSWIQSQVASAAGSHKYKHLFAFSHAPVFSVSDGYRNAKENMLNVWKSIDNAKFDIYFGAHEHLYSRRVIDSSIKVKSGGTEYSFKNNVIHIISGDAGASPVTRWVEDKQDWHIEPSWNYVLVTVDGDSAAYNAYKVDKSYNVTLIDSGVTNAHTLSQGNM